MTYDTLQDSIKEAKRFLQKAQLVVFNKYDDPEDHAASAACKRASLDLTKALAAMRRP